MSPKKIIIVFMLVVISLGTLTAYAGLHFVGSASFGGGSLVAQVTIAGFGQRTDTVTVTLQATGTDMEARCQNKGGNQAPGQNPVDVNVTVSAQVTPDQNGTASAQFHVNLLPSSDAAGCPNRNWIVTDLFGTLNVLITANDSATNTSDSMAFVCTINESQKSVDCTQVSP